MRTRNNFNIIGQNQNAISLSSVGGVFSVDDQRFARQADAWPFIRTAPDSIELLVVAGGGSGGGARDSESGGGGAGGLLYGSSISVAPDTTYNIIVGAGAAASGDIGGTGSNSEAFGCTALGGGGGGRGIRFNHADGTSGGSGGAGTGWESFRNGGAATQTNSGGAIGYGFRGQNGGAGGGGAGEIGGTAGGGIGGIGREYSQFTDAGFPAGWYSGGGTGFNKSPRNGGGGGNQGTNQNGNAGQPNSGGGGAGAYTNTQSVTVVGGAGGSGVVALRYSVSFPTATNTTGNPTYTVSGGYRVYTFTSSGSITF